MKYIISVLGSKTQYQIVTLSKSFNNVNNNNNTFDRKSLLVIDLFVIIQCTCIYNLYVQM
jgi:hypothetical protein